MPRFLPLFALLALFSSACVIEREGDAAIAAADTDAPAPASTPPDNEEEEEEEEEEDGDDDTETTTTVAAEAKPRIEGLEIVLDPILEIDQPVAMAVRPGVDNAFYIAERDGQIRKIEIGTSRAGKVTYRTITPALIDMEEDISVTAERGLLGLAFSLNGRRMFVAYSDKGSGDTVIDEYRFQNSSTFERLSTNSRREVLRIRQPYDNHNGGAMHVGPDGYLYIAMGDGGNSGDPDGNGQDATTLLAAMLRIDPEGSGETLPYGVPLSNPFVDGVSGRPEVWAYGLRDPWRFSFDRATGDLWIGDIGERSIEEITLLRAAAGGGRGANLGWSVLEGTEAIDGSTPSGDEVDPVFTYPHEGRCAVTGGYVYRGEAIPELVGTYVYGDRCEAKLRGLVVDDADEVVIEAELGPRVPSGSLVSFGEDAFGELYVLTLDENQVYKLIPEPPPEDDDENDDR